MASSDNPQEAYYGYLSQACIFDLAKLPELFQNHSLLITCLDSTPAPWESGWPYADQMKWKMETFSNGYWIDQSDVQRVATDMHVFSLYSEVYAFGDNRKPANYDRLKHYTSDGFHFDREVPDDFKRSFLALDADLYLSDGHGLNYACRSKEKLDLFERFSL